ncbi:MAG: dTMP kinase, partial [Chloroflexi bacterium]
MSLFVSFEGPEGGGKTTQAQQLADALSAAGHAVVNTREPGGTPIGNQVRQLLLDHGSAGMQPQTEFLLFSASRAQLVREVIEPQLARGGVVLCDRFYDS